MPRNRGKIVTAARDTSMLGEVLSFLRTQLEKGRQLYVIYPLIDESDKLDVKAAAAEYELWRERCIRSDASCFMAGFRRRKSSTSWIGSARRHQRVDQHDRARGRRRCAKCSYNAD